MKVRYFLYPSTPEYIHMAEGGWVCCLHSLGPGPYPLHFPCEELHESIGWGGLGAGEVVRWGGLGAVRGWGIGLVAAQGSGVGCSAYLLILPVSHVVQLLSVILCRRLRISNNCVVRVPKLNSSKHFLNVHYDHWLDTLVPYEVYPEDDLQNELSVDTVAWEKGRGAVIYDVIP